MIRSLLLPCIALLFTAGCAAASPGKTTFHPPQTEAEKALNNIFERDRTGDLNMYAYILGRPDYKPEDDPGYNKLMTSSFIQATREKERQLVRDNCAGEYREGETCGIDIHLPVCGQDMTDLGFAFQTTHETPTESYIRYVWLEHLKDAEPYGKPDIKMIKSNDRWLLDGLDCGHGYTFNI